MTGVALDHLVRRFEAGGRNVGDGQALVRGLVGAQHRRVRHKRKVDPGRQKESRLNFGAKILFQISSKLDVDVFEKNHPSAVLTSLCLIEILVFTVDVIWLRQH